MSRMLPDLGFGLGLRKDDYETILSEKPPVESFEALTENYLVPGGKPLYYLERIREQQGSEPIPFEQNEYPIGWAVWRRDLQTFYRSLDVDEAWALDAAANGESFGAICAGITEWVDELNAPQQAAGMVGRWVEEGLISAVET
jgi:hypothetical protein